MGRASTRRAAERAEIYNVGGWYDSPMDAPPSPSAAPAMGAPAAADSTNTIIIMLLLFALALSMMGVDVFIIASGIAGEVRRAVGPPISGLLSGMGYSAGTIIDKSADVAADAAKTGVDIAEGTAQSVGDLLIQASGARSLDDAVNRGKARAPRDPRPSDGDASIQKPISAGKAGWCLVGEYEGKRGCVAVGEADRCLSGQLFPSQALCMNPTQSSNMQGQPPAFVRQ